MRPEKKYAVEFLKKHLEQHPCAILTDYKGISSEKINAVRSELEKKQSAYEVVKNRLFSIAASEMGIKGMERFLKGQVGVVFTTEDQSIEILKFLSKYRRENETMGFLGGFIEGAVYSGEQLEALAKLPGKDAMRAKLLGTLLGPLSGFGNVLRGRLLSLLYVINAIIDKKGGAGTAETPEQGQ